MDRVGSMPGNLPSPTHPRGVRQLSVAGCRAGHRAPRGLTLVVVGRPDNPRSCHFIAIRRRSCSAARAASNARRWARLFSLTLAIRMRPPCCSLAWPDVPVASLPSHPLSSTPHPGVPPHDEPNVPALRRCEEPSYMPWHRNSADARSSGCTAYRKPRTFLAWSTVGQAHEVLGI